MDGIEDSVPTRQDTSGDASAREAALREILQVISESRDDATPVFETLLRAAQRLFGATNGAIVLAEEGGGPQILAAQTGASDETLARYESGGFPMDPRESLAARAIVERKTLHFEDVAKGAPYRDGMEAARMHVEKEGIKSSIYVPLISNDRGIGCLNLLHKEQHTYSPDEIALVQSFAAQAVIAIENVRQFHELKTRLEREAATREILEVISESRDDERPVFDTILDNVSRLCNAPLVFLSIVDASRKQLTIPAHRGARSKIAGVWDTMIEPLASSALVSAHAIRDCRAIHVPDLSQDPTFDMTDARRAELVELEDVRSYLVVPLRRGDRAIGTINLYRREVAPFTREQIALVETFASQAVIAIENVRQFRELQTRLEREAATREILHVISQSPDNEKPVFDVILENAAKLCNSSMARLHLLEDGGERRRLVAHWGDALQTLKIGETMPMGLAHPISRTIRECQLIHTEDISQTELYTNGDELFRRLVDEEQLRTLLTVPLIRDGAAFGCIAISRRKVKAFAPDEISLVESFAAQAVIAIENVRQFRELQIRLGREAATREILEVISQNRADDTPVFNMILQKAVDLCGAHIAGLNLVSEDGTRLQGIMTSGSVSEIWQDGQYAFSMDDPSTLLVRSVKDQKTIHIRDLAETDSYLDGSSSVRTSLVDDEGIRTWMAVPLVRDGVGIGCFGLFRKEVRPFTEDQIKLVETFAAQAVIAIDNVRQFRELQNRLEREAATREILQIISRSRDDEAPVFDVILENTARICRVPFAGLHLAQKDRASVELVAHMGMRSSTLNIWNASFPIDGDAVVARCTRTAEVIHVEDMADDDLYRQGYEPRVQVVDVEGVRTLLAVPLLKDGVGIGCIWAFRREVSPFSAADIDLLQGFAAQAVIALENVRQFTAIQVANAELKSRLEREAATRKVLEVISRSRDDEGPVFAMILEQAARLCQAPQAGLILASEDRTTVKYTASWGPPSRHFEPGVSQWSMDSPIAISTAIRESRVVNIADTMNDEPDRQSHPDRLEILEEEQIRSILAVPLLKDGHAIGCFDVYRLEVAPFSDDDVKLLEAFAAQAVIAIENVRQFRELQNRLEREAASAEILEVISQSQDDYHAVFDLVAKRARRLCAAKSAWLFLLSQDRQTLEIVSSSGASQELISLFEAEPPPLDDPESSFAKVVSSLALVHEEDVRTTLRYQSETSQRRRAADIEELRTTLHLPLIAAGQCVGVLALHRDQVKAFSEDDIVLLQSFAGQASIALENVRQFKALESRTDEVQALNASLEERVEEQVGEIERMGRLKRFLPAAVADTVVSQGSDKMLSSHRALLGVLFCDIRGFTAFCETAEPEETIEVLQTYHQEMGRLINDHGAGVDHRMGDGIMVLFNDPLPCDDPAGEAVRLALAMRDRMEELCQKWKRLGHRLGFGVGISLGYATVGMVGYEGRYDYTASGTAVNIAARLCDHAEDGEILLSPRAWTAVEDRIATTSRGEISFKGINREIEVMCIEPGTVLAE